MFGHLDDVVGGDLGGFGQDLGFLHVRTRGGTEEKRKKKESRVKLKQQQQRCRGVFFLSTLFCGNLFVSKRSFKCGVLGTVFG